MIGFNIAQEGHVIPVVLPQNVTGGVNGQIFSMKGAAHVSIVISIGALAAQLGAITLNACKTLAGGSATAIGFRYAIQTTAGVGNDVLPSSFTVATTAGFTPPNTPNVVAVIELDAAELDSLGDSDGADYPYLQLVIANGANANYVSVVAIQSALHQAYAGNPSATV